KPIVVLHGY
nr:Chain C, PEPTIDE [Homo sapiens]2H6P_C Chain C, mer peptide from Cytochrome P450 [synthetic construct]